MWGQCTGLLVAGLRLVMDVKAKMQGQRPLGNRGGMKKGDEEDDNTAEDTAVSDDGTLQAPLVQRLSNRIVLGQHPKRGC